MKQETGDWYCPKCQTYIMGQNVTYTERHDDCGTPVEWHPAEHQMPNIPRWANLLIAAGLVAAILVGLAIAEKHNNKKKQERKDQKTIENCSRMSDSQEIQEAYDRLYPLK